MWLGSLYLVSQTNVCTLLCVGVQEGLFVWVNRGFTSTVASSEASVLFFSGFPFLQKKEHNREPVHMDTDKTVIDQLG